MKSTDSFCAEVYYRPLGPFSVKSKCLGHLNSPMRYKRISILLMAVALATILRGQTGSKQTAPENDHRPIEILSDTKGMTRFFNNDQSPVGADSPPGLTRTIGEWSTRGNDPALRNRLIKRAASTGRTLTRHAKPLPIFLRGLHPLFTISERTCDCGFQACCAIENRQRIMNRL